MNDIYDIFTKEQLVAILRSKDQTICDKDQNIGNLQAQMDMLEKSILILHVRSRVKELEQRFLKPYMISWTRYNKWNKILRGAMHNLKKNAELRRFRATVTVDNQEFIKTIVSLCKEFSEVAVHGIHYPVKYDDDSIGEMLVKNKITPDQSKIDVVKIILTPIP